MASEIVEPKGMYAGGKAIGKASERRKVVTFIRRFADALSVESQCGSEKAAAFKALALAIECGHHAENQ